MDGSSHGDADPDWLSWERGNLRGLPGRKRFVRVEKDPETGLDVNIYELVDDTDEWGV